MIEVSILEFYWTNKFLSPPSLAAALGQLKQRGWCNKFKFGKDSGRERKRKRKLVLFLGIFANIKC